MPTCGCSPGSGHPLSLNLLKMLRPVPETARFAETDYYVWCGTMVRHDDGRYYLLYSRWPRDLGHCAWVTHSEVAIAVSDSPLGPYRPCGVALPPRGPGYWDGMCTHNPTVIQSRGKYYLYYMGNRGDGKTREQLAKDAVAPELEKSYCLTGLNWTHRNNQRIGVAVADHPAGPWLRFDQPLINTTPGFWDALCCANPSVTERPDGGYLMVYKAVGDKNPLPFGGPVVHVAALSEHATGPFVKQPAPVFYKEGEPFCAEDPFIWYQGHQYWAVVKDNHGVFTDAGKSLVLFESHNGLDWVLSPNALVSRIEVDWEKGGTQKLNSLVRPQIWFDDDRPAVLFCAADESPGRTHSFNVHIPLASDPGIDPAGVVAPCGQ